MQKIEKVLAKRAMVPADLTRLTGISSSRLSKLSQGQGQLRIPEILRISRALDISVEYLIDDEMTDETNAHKTVTPQELAVLEAVRDSKLSMFEAIKALVQEGERKAREASPNPTEFHHVDMRTNKQDRRSS